MGGGGDVGAHVNVFELQRKFESIPSDVKKPGHVYIILLTAFAGLGGFLFGYDVGVVGSLFAMPAFKSTMYGTETPDPVKFAFDQGWIVSFFALGAAVGAFVNGWLSDAIGRKKTVIVGAVLFLLGGGLQAGAMSIPMLYVGRCLAGLSIGSLSMIIPLYQAEMAPPSVRGRLVSLNQLLIVTGVASSFWIDYATQVTIPHSSWVFRHPLLAQCYVAGILLAGMLFMPESVRWLLKRDQREQALKNLAFIRQLPADNPYVKYEFEEIETVIGEEKKLPSGRWLELFGPEMRRRVLVGVFLQLFQQLGGTNATTYYATTFYGLLGFADPNMKLLLQGFYGVVKIVLTIPALIWLDKWGRRKFLMIGGIGMALNQLALGIMIRVVAGDCHSDACTKAAFANHPALGPLGVFFLWFYISWYAWSWGPIPWVYIAEIYPLRHRAKAMALAAAFDWLGNFTVGQLVPNWISRNNYGPFFFFFSTCTFMVIATYLWVPETKDVALEEMDALFEGGVKGRRESEDEAEGGRNVMVEDLVVKAK